MGRDCICALLLCLALIMPIGAQEPVADEKKPQKMLVKVTPIDGDLEPVKLVCHNLEQKEDWLKDLSIEVENVSGKAIKYLECVALVCDNTKEYCVAIPMVYGKVTSRSVSMDDFAGPGKQLPPGIMRETPAPRKKSAKNTPPPPEPVKPAEPQFEPIAPGARIKLSVTESAYVSGRKMLEQIGPLTSVNSADLVFGQAHFTDGSGWNNESLIPSGSLGRYKSGESSFVVSKEDYIWGYLRNRDRIYNNIYAGPAAITDDKGGTTRIQGYNRRMRANRSAGGVTFIVSGG